MLPQICFISKISPKTATESVPGLAYFLLSCDIVDADGRTDGRRTLEYGYIMTAHVS